MPLKRWTVILACVFVIALQSFGYAQMSITAWGQIAPGVGVIGEQLEKMLREFEAETGIRVEYVSNSEAEHHAKFVQAVIGGIAPDVVWTTSAGGWGDEQRLLLPLDDFLARSGVADWEDFFGAPKENAVGIRTGQIYGVPMETDARPLLWNQELFANAGLPADQPPVYWDELLSFTRRLTRFDADHRLEAAGFEFGGQGQWLPVWLGTSGGQIWDESVMPPVAIPDMPSMVRALEFVRELVLIQGGWPAYSEYTARTPNHLARFRSTTAMYIAGSWEIPSIKRTFPNLEFGITHVPIHREHGARYTLAGGWMLAIPAEASNPELGWQFIEWMTSPERIAEWAAVNGYVPPRYTAAQMSEFRFWPESAVVEVAMHGAGWPRGYPGTGYDWNQAFWDVVQGFEPPQTAALKTKESMQVAADLYFADDN